MIFKDKDKDKIKERATQPIFLEEQPERGFSMLQVGTAIEGCADECLSFKPVENRVILSAFGQKVYSCEHRRGCKHAIDCYEKKKQEEQGKDSEFALRYIVEAYKDGCLGVSLLANAKDIGRRAWAHLPEFDEVRIRIATAEEIEELTRAGRAESEE